MRNTDVLIAPTILAALRLTGCLYFDGTYSRRASSVSSSFPFVFFYHHERAPLPVLSGQ